MKHAGFRVGWRQGGIRWFASALLLLACISADAVGAEPAAVRAGSVVSEASAIIQRLGDDAFAVRNAAVDRLLAEGEAAREALTAGMQHTDPEIRDRCEQLLAALNSRRRMAEKASQEARIAAFLEDDQAGTKEYSFPLWRQFCADVGSDRAARELFAEMQRSEAELLDTAGAANTVESTRALSDAMQQRIMVVSRSMSHPLPQFRTQITPGRAAALYYVASLENVRLSGTAGSQLYSMAHQPQVNTIVRDAKNGALLRGIVRRWITIEQPGDINLPYYKLILATQFEMKEGLDVARRMLTDQRGVSASYLSQAVMAICKFGGKEQMRELEGLLGNKTVCYRMHINNKIYTTEVRDVALAALIQVTGQSHADYGLDRMSKTSATVFTPHNVGYPEDEASKRTEAFAKWDRWKAGQKRDDGGKLGPPRATEPG